MLESPFRVFLARIEIQLSRDHVKFCVFVVVAVCLKILVLFQLKKSLTTTFSEQQLQKNYT